MTPPPVIKRHYCAACLRPQRTCICHWITPIAHAVEVLILQHPQEADQAKGSARLLHLSLPHSRLVIGEIFPLPELQALLHAPFDRQSDHVARAEQTIPRTVLLYPAADRASAVSAPALVEQSLREVPPHLRLVVLDATWRKSRKMLYLNPLLQQLPRLTLRDPPPSQYLIRQSHRPHQRSTLEATCFALMQLERSDEKYLPLLTAFQGFVAQQAGYMPVRRDSQSN